MYRNGQYSLAIFHLQQTSEKAFKALLLQSGYIEVNDLLQISHNARKTFAKALEKQKTYSDIMKDMWKPGKEFDMDSPSVRAMISRKYDIDDVKISKDKLTENLEFLVNYDPVEQAKEFTTDEEYIESIKIFSKKFWARGVLIVLSDILSTHESCSRYPSTNSLHQEPDDYNKDCPIVELSPEMAQLLFEAIRRLFVHFMVEERSKKKLDEKDKVENSKQEIMKNTGLMKLIENARLINLLKVE